ncbi:MAG: type 4a pilus biogenesis protein PilO [Cocleimonas sp.]|nr:type 4a pilus biogenesis protein PilO [Cocleimonas sp.]
MDFQEFNSLMEDPGNVSMPVKIIAIIIIIVAVLFLGYKMVITDQIEHLERAQREEQGLRVTYEKKQARANQLPAYKAQLDEMQQSFGSLIKQLPSDTEIPGLILDISEKGLSNGLEIDLFEPKPELRKEFYAIKPIKLKAKGQYDELASFVSDLSALPRIVTINDIRLEPEKEKNTTPTKSNTRRKKPVKRIVMEATIQTYRYMEEGADEEEGDV